MSSDALLHDIVCHQDVHLMVDLFYDKVKIDPLLGPAFSHVDWIKHLPVMYDFWSSMLLGDRTYRGNPLQRHLDLPIDRRHFDRWLLLFEETVNDNFFGERADEAKSRAQAIAEIFQRKMGLQRLGD
ncbi:sec-independent protein translocase TatC [Pseudochryseolinea flava]|uniref:Sec-independent protein translocase TatC n=2 Tax=Pseudochryseolinea flava TaxID=2059302 RepID=A0A364YAV3_9BACT|nr:sec-independent protein translocase TatC [Pseudochryseolinea flava]